MKIVVFGDSITAGYDATTGGERISPVLKRELEKLLLGVEVQLRGVCGEDTDEAILRLNTVLAEQADKTVIFFGANDAAADHTISPAGFYKNLQIFVENLGVARVLLLTPPYHNDQVDTEPRNNAYVRLYTEAALQVAADFGVAVINLSEEMQKTGQPDELLQTDGLHFSQQGYSFLAQQIAKALN